MKSMISVKKARNILGDDATSMSDTEILDLISTLDLLDKDAIQEAKKRIRMKKRRKGIS